MSTVHAYILPTTKPILIAQTIIKSLKLKIDVEKFFKHPDILVIKAQPHITIAQIRRLQKNLSRKPFQFNRQIALILEAQKMTIPAQNAFLKLLEEPNQYTIIYMATPNSQQLLPTLLSRSQLINLPGERPTFSPSQNQLSPTEKINRQELRALLKKLSSIGIGERLILVEPYAKNRDTTLNFCHQLIDFLEKELHSSERQLSQIQIGKILANTLQLLKHLEANLNPKLSLDHWALSL